MHTLSNAQMYLAQIVTQTWQVIHYGLIVLMLANVVLGGLTHNNHERYSRHIALLAFAYIAFPPAFMWLAWLGLLPR